MHWQMGALRPHQLLRSEKGLYHRMAYGICNGVGYFQDCQEVMRGLH